MLYCIRYPVKRVWKERLFTMAELKEIKQEEKKEERKRKGISPIILRDIMDTFNPTAPPNTYYTADNPFYHAAELVGANKKYAVLPYLLPNKVFVSDAKIMQDISMKKLGVSAFTFLDGAAQAAACMYASSGVRKPGNVNYRFLTQAYYLYTALCVAVTPKGHISLVTASANVLDILPLLPCDKEKIYQRLKMTTDDVDNGIIQCVELVPRFMGYEVRPATINASRSNYCIMPKDWLDFFIDGIKYMLGRNKCKVTCLLPDGKPDTIIATTKHSSDLVVNSYRRYITGATDRYGFIRFLDDENKLRAFPINRLISIEPLV